MPSINTMPKSQAKVPKKIQLYKILACYTPYKQKSQKNVARSKVLM